MSEDESNARRLRERIALAAPFDQVAIVRCLTDRLPPWPTNLSVEGDDERSNRFAALLSAASAESSENRKLEPSEAGELAALLFPIALLDPSLAAPIRDAANRHELDESMNAIEVLTYSAAISFVILVATTELEWRNGKCVRIVKKAIGDKTLLRLIELLDKFYRAKM